MTARAEKKQWYMAVCPVAMAHDEAEISEKLQRAGLPSREVARIREISNAAVRAQSLAARYALFGAFLLWMGGEGERPCYPEEWPEPDKASKAWIRTVLGDWRVSPAGKPACPAGGLDFSLTHTEQVAVAVLSGVPGRPIGVDAETETRHVADWERMANRFYSPEEREKCHSTADFLAVWLRKEALGKARGTGLVGLLEPAAREPEAGEGQPPVYTEGKLPDGTRYAVCFLGESSPAGNGLPG